MANYWIFKVTDAKNEKYSKEGIQIYNHRMSEFFWGIKEFTKNGRKAANIDHLRKGDAALFYLVGTRGHCFLGTCKLNSGFIRPKPGELEKITHEEYLDWKEGVFLDKDTIHVWAKPLPIERLRGKVHFVPNGENYGSYLQGSVTRIRNQQDYYAVVHEHELMQ